MATQASVLADIQPQVALTVPPPAVAAPTIAVVGLGYVGLPTSLALLTAGSPVIGVDVSDRRLGAIREGDVDLATHDRVRLAAAVAGEELRLTADASAIAQADAVVICVPTPVDAERRPDLRALRGACEAVVAHARAGQTLILTSTTYVGTTRELLVDPVAERGFDIGRDIFVAFAPERINPGDQSFQHTAVPRVIGGTTPACTAAAMRVLRSTAGHLHVVSSPEAAELTKLQENTFRAVNLAFANEMADVSSHYGLDPIELVTAAATKPYGYLAHYPGAGVGGHCIPVDPHYLLAPLHEADKAAPIAEQAMAAIDARPMQVADRAIELLREHGTPDGRILVVGMSYKPGVADARESPAHLIIQRLAVAGVDVAFHDPLIDEVALADGRRLPAVAAPRSEDYALAVVVTVHPGHDYEWLADCEHVLDATYRTPGGRHRHTL